MAAGRLRSRTRPCKTDSARGCSRDRGQRVFEESHDRQAASYLAGVGPDLNAKANPIWYKDESAEITILKSKRGSTHRYLELSMVYDYAASRTQLELNERMSMPVNWTQIDDTLYATFMPDRGVCYRLIVEQLSGKDGWDWAVWCAGQSLSNVWYGVERSSRIAMIKAETYVNAVPESRTLN
jgi:hypothetical protein